MSVREIRPSVYEIAVYTGARDERGRRVRVTRTVHGGKRAARDAERALKTEAVQGRALRRDDVLAGYLTRYLDSRRTKLAAQTLSTYSERAERYILPTLGARRLVDIDSLAVSNLHAEASPRPGSRRPPFAASIAR